MRRPPVVTTAIVAGLMMITAPAQAKFNIRLVVSGPGLAGPIELFNAGMDIGCVFSRPCNLASRAPARPLGPRYEVIESLEGHHARGRMMDRIVHDLYPYAPGGPRVFTAPGQTWHDWNRKRHIPGGWTRAGHDLFDALTAAGLPQQPPQPPVRVAAIRSPAPKAATADDGTVWAWLVPVALATLLAGGLLFPRPR
ncbi:MAG TPA: hypothetical protein VFH75_00500 [Actinomycetota bacterium]|nr:hypothetical protein [Actinomycetota bacterium]